MAPSLSFFRDLPTELLHILYHAGNAEPTLHPPWERMIFTVARDGVLFAHYLSVDLRRTKTPCVFNRGYLEEYPTTEEQELEEEELEVDQHEL